jgi:hypothetical protein
VFIGESLLDVKRQVDQLTIEDVLQAAIQALQQIRATDDRTADATNQIVPALEYIRVQLTSLLEQPTLPELTREGWLENARSLLQQDSGTWWMRVVHLLRIKPGKKSSSMTPDDRGRKAA